MALWIGNIHPKALFVSTMVLTFLGMGCHSNQSRAKEETRAEAGAPHNPALLLNLNCPFDWVNKPTESFHYSYSRRRGSESTTQEADVSPQALDGTLNFVSDGAANPRTMVHAVSSDGDAWRRAAGQLSMGFGMPSSLMMANKMSDALVKEGAENVNGYDTVRYSVDTSRLGVTDRTLLGTNSEKGTIWVTGPGCPVKIIMDTEAQGNNGAVVKTHYEEAIVKN